MKFIKTWEPHGKTDWYVIITPRKCSQGLPRNRITSSMFMAQKDQVPVSLNQFSKFLNCIILASSQKFLGWWANVSTVVFQRISPFSVVCHFVKRKHKSNQLWSKRILHSYNWQMYCFVSLYYTYRWPSIYPNILTSATQINSKSELNQLK